MVPKRLGIGFTLNFGNPLAVCTPPYPIYRSCVSGCFVFLRDDYWQSVEVRLKLPLEC